MTFVPRRPSEVGVMAVTLPAARPLSDETLGALRLRALDGCELGYTEAEVADLLGVGRETARRRWSAYAGGGVAALPGGAAGAAVGVRADARRRPGTTRPRVDPGAHAGGVGHRRPAVESPGRPRPDPPGVRRH